MKSLLFGLCLLSVLLLSSFVVAESPYGGSYCNEFLIGEDTYLTGDVYVDDGSFEGTANYCFDVVMGTLDCKGYSIYGNGVPSHRLVNVYSGTVQNCVFVMNDDANYAVDDVAGSGVIRNNTFVRSSNSGLTSIYSRGSLIDANVFFVGSGLAEIVIDAAGAVISNNVFHMVHEAGTPSVIYQPHLASSIVNNTFNISAFPECSYSGGEFGENWGAATVLNNFYVGSCGQAADYSLTCVDANDDGFCDVGFTFDLAVDITDSAPRVFGWEPTPPCTPDWYCSGFASCSELNVSACTGVVDANACDEAFGGSLSAFDESCVFVPPCVPSWSCSLFGACELSNTQPCLQVTDANACGEAFGGSLGDYVQSCVFGGGGSPALVGGSVLSSTVLEPAAVEGAFLQLQSVVGSSADTSGIRAFFVMLWDWLVFWR